MRLRRIGRRGEATDASNAGSLIGVITLLIVFYIIFIPPEDRFELLEGKNTSTSRIAGESANVSRVLLLANVGHLDYRGQKTIDHTLPNLYLSEARSAEVIERTNPFVVRSALFTNTPREFSFVVDDVARVSNVNLVFNVEKASRTGVLRVLLNGYLVYEGSPSRGSIAPIQLKQDLLQRSNTLRFETDSVGLAFWRTNEFALTNVQVIGDRADLERQESINSFVIPATEYEAVEKATLSFTPVCDQRDAGTITVTLNGQTVFKGTPDCETLNKRDLLKEDLTVGRNAIVFKITGGDYRLEQIRLRTELKDVKPFTSYFELNSTEYRNVQVGRRSLILAIQFVDDDEDKIAEVNINGHRTTIDQRTPTYKNDISRFAIEGSNYIQLIPQSTLDIPRLEVRLEE